MNASSPLRPLVDALERASVLDLPGKAAGKAVRGVVAPGTAKEVLSGTWLGHAVHPPLTDVVIGSFLGASMLDVVGRDSARDAQRLLQVGLLAALPTALTGINDWADTEIADARVRRVGVAHASVNVTALTLYTASLTARRRGARGRGAAFALAGAAALTAGGFLGGHMSYTRGVGPNQTAFDAGPTEWTAVAGVGELVEGAPTAGTAADTPVFLVRRGGAIHAMHNRCSHRGCSLSDGELEGDVVTCPCHGSRFDIRDGSVVRGPATAEQPSFETRDAAGRIEVRLRRSAA
jgi:nitrite reductase/ring-hydroxylating ferredoxin subunit/uncharacterized membrane protein